MCLISCLFVFLFSSGAPSSVKEMSERSAVKIVDRPRKIWHEDSGDKIASWELLDVNWDEFHT